MYQPTAQFIDQWLEAWTGNEPDILMGYYASDAFYLDPANPSGLSGYTAIRSYFQKLLAKNPKWVWKAQEIFEAPNGCILKWQADIPLHSGKRIKLEGVDILEISAGLILRNEVYFDRTPWLQALQATNA